MEKNYPKIIFLGCGKMGEIILEKTFLHLQENNLVKISCNINGKKKANIIENIIICRKNIKKNLFLNSNNIAVNFLQFKLDQLPQNYCADIIFICVKPQDSQEILCNFFAQKNSYHQNSIFISILAGKTISFFANLAKFFNIQNAKIVRTMPNIAIKYSGGIFPYKINKNILVNEHKMLQNYFANFGKIFLVKKESNFNFFTAIFGCGPAYIFFLQQVFFQILCQKKISSKIAKELTAELFFGSANFALKEKKPFTEMMQKVASKKGATEMALQYLFSSGQIKDSIEKAVEIATIRCQELSQNS